MSEKAPTPTGEAAAGWLAPETPATRPRRLFPDLALRAAPLGPSSGVAGPSRLQARKDQHTL